MIFPQTIENPDWNSHTNDNVYQYIAENKLPKSTESKKSFILKQTTVSDWANQKSIKLLNS